MDMSTSIAAMTGYTSAQDKATQETKPATDPMANKETFLRLLVAQLKNQDPLQPMDGLQFVSQLAQFSELEQLMSIRQGIDALNESIATQAEGQTGTTPPAE
jgi:flagellar basal-body rod modification protein FlgD